MPQGRGVVGQQPVLAGIPDFVERPSLSFRLGQFGYGDQGRAPAGGRRRGRRTAASRRGGRNGGCSSGPPSPTRPGATQTVHHRRRCRPQGLSGRCRPSVLVRSPYRERYASRAMIPPSEKIPSLSRRRGVRKDRRPHPHRSPRGSRGLYLFSTLLALLGVLDDYLVVFGWRRAPPAEAQWLATQASGSLFSLISAGRGRALVRHRQDVHRA